MADLMWSTVKEPLDSALCFDKESLDLAFKYFMSPTLTMRLAGLSQITVSLKTRQKSFGSVGLLSILSERTRPQENYSPAHRVFVLSEPAPHVQRRLQQRVAGVRHRNVS